MKPILTDQGFAYRTKAMPDEQQARAFAACLKKNSRFKSVELVKSERTKAPSWYVTFQPARAERCMEIAQGQQAERAERAATQEFTFVLEDELSRPFFYCHSHKSGEVYDLTERGCSCPDDIYRCRPAGIECKHRISLRQAIKDGTVLQW